MKEVFISHSSADKASYADYIANKLGVHCNYDSFSFEAGEKTKDEVVRCIQESFLHVVLISESSLQSDWVQYELKLIYEKLLKNRFDSFFPIIIDRKISYQDSRIPKWIRESYNLKPIYKPSVAYWKIKNKLISLKMQKGSSYDFHHLFFGRNEEMQKIDERFNDFEKDVPKCLVVSGLKGSGRKTLIKEALIKNNVLNRSNTPLLISLDRQMSIENLIQQCNGYVPDAVDTSCLSRFNMEEKIALLRTIIKFFQEQHIFLIIEDAGCIIDSRGELSYWFEKSLNGLVNSTIIGISAQHQLSRVKYKNLDDIFAINISTFTKVERNALLKACAEKKKVQLDREELLFISNLLTGFPDQIFFAIELIQENGFKFVKDNSCQIVEYAEDRVQEVIKYISRDEKKYDLLVLIASFDFISVALIEEITKENYPKEILPQLLNINLIEKFGAFGEYLKVNDAVKDFISRSRITSKIDVIPYLTSQLTYVKNNNEYIKELDIDTMNWIVTTSIESGQDIADIAIPSHYLKTIIDLYNSTKYNEVIAIVDKLKDSETIERYDARITAQIYDYYCLSLARERNERIWKEMGNIKDEADYHFIRAFAYKKLGKNKQAYQEAIKALNIRSDERAKRILVDILILSNAYDEAFVYAKENYENKPNNPYHIQAYFNCLIKRDKAEKEILERLSLEMKAIQSKLAQDMFCDIKARYLFEVENKCGEAARLVQQRLNTTTKGRRYLLMTLFDIYAQERNIDGMKTVITDRDFTNMQKILDTKNNYYYRMAIFNCIANEPWLSVERQVSQMQFVSDDFKTNTLERIARIYNK